MLMSKFNLRFEKFVSKFSIGSVIIFLKNVWISFFFLSSSSKYPQQVSSKNFECCSIFKRLLISSFNNKAKTYIKFSSMKVEERIFS